MPTDIYFPLPSSTTGALAEHHPYGPIPGGVFNTDLGVEIQQAELSAHPLLATVDGILRLIPAPVSPVMILVPAPKPTADLRSVVGDSQICFLYRNIDITSVGNAPGVMEAMEIWRVSKLNETSATLAQIQTEFEEGKFTLFVKAGDKLGLVAEPTSVGNPQLGFEVIYLPNALSGPIGWQRVKEIIDPNNETTRRLDPTSFYQLILSGSSSSTHVKLPDSQNPHSLLPDLSPRILLELRDEYNRPFQGEVNVSNGGVLIKHTLAALQRGTLVLPLASAGENSVTIKNRVLTELPSGSNASPRPQKLLTAPAHWSLQSMFMAHIDSNENWFAQNDSILPLFTSENRVTPLIDGNATYKEVVDVIEKIRGSTEKHFLRVAGWWLSDQFEMINGNPETTFEKLSQRVAASGSKVHALIWRQGNIDLETIVHPEAPPVDLDPVPHLIKENSNTVKRINQLKQGTIRMGFAILDPAKPEVSSHHQKLIIASLGNKPAIAFCGGIDINPNRLDSPAHSVNDPYHDIHAKVEGPAVADLNATFVERWNANNKVAPTGNLPRISNSASLETSPVGTHFVQVTRIYPKKANYPFAPDGEAGTLLTLQRAIHRAKRFIYFEDQYAHPFPKTNDNGSGDTVGILTALLEALRRIEFLIIVVPENNTPHTQRKYRFRFLRILLNEAEKPEVKAKVLVFYGRRPSFSNQQSLTKSRLFPSVSDFFTHLIEPSIQKTSLARIVKKELIFLHSKVWLIDDHYVKIGSANVNRRSLTHDSELDLHVIDGALTRGARTFALDFRLALWSEWLQIQSDRILLEDPTYALQFWESPSAESFVRLYDPAANKGNWPISSREKGAWDTVFDPDGT